MNETRVTPASLIGRKLTGGLVELLVLDPVIAGAASGQESCAVRTCLVRSSKRLRQGAAIQIGSGPEITVEGIVGPGRVRVRFPVLEGEFLAS